MKFYKKAAAVLLSLIAAVSIATTTVFAEPTETVDDPQTSVDTPAEDQPGNTGDNEPAQPVTPDTPADSTPSTGGNESTPNSNTGGNNYNSYDNNTNYSNNNQPYYYDDSYSRSGSVVDRDNDYYQPGTMGEDSTQPVVDNKLYNASLAGDSAEMNADDWNIALTLDDTGGGNDFNFIKNNDSADDSVLYQLMLFGGVLLITVAAFGIILIIVLTVRTSKRNKRLIAKAQAEQIVDISSFDTHSTVQAEEKPAAETDFGSISEKVNESEPADKASDSEGKVDVDNLDLSKYDKYL